MGPSYYLKPQVSDNQITSVQPPLCPLTAPMMTAVLKCILFAILLTLATKLSSGATSTASYEELLQAVKSGKFTVDKASKSKDNSEDILQELLNKSEFCFVLLHIISLSSRHIGEILG